MKTMTVDEFHQACKDQGATRQEEVVLVCPLCGTPQCAIDLINAGAGETFDQVEKYLGFSCVGRFTNAPQPRKKPDGKPCNWTLGGFFKLHKLEVVTPDGKHHPTFEPASPEVAKQHLATLLANTIKDSQ